jgi:transposase
LGHVHNTNSQYHLPEIGKKIAYKANRAGVAERFEDVAVQKTMEGDLALLTSYDQLLNDLALFILRTARPHDAHTRDLLHTVPGMGKLLRLVLLYDIHDINRFPRGQDCASSCRLVKCAKESGGKRVGTAGNKMGNAHLKGAFSAAAPLFLRGHEPGQKLLARGEKKHDKGKALSILAHKLARAVYCLLKRHTTFDLEHFLRTERSRASEPGAELAPEGRSLHRTDMKPHMAAAENAEVRLGPISLSPAR